MDQDSPADHEDLASQVQAFAERYLYAGLNEAAANEENPDVAIFALMECMRILLESNIAEKAEAMAEFKSLTEAYMNDWRQYPK